MKEVMQMPGKGNGPEETLRKGKQPKADNSLKCASSHQAETMMTTSDGGSNLETLRQGSKPKGMKCPSKAPIDMKAQKRAMMLNERSIMGGAEKEGGW